MITRYGQFVDNKLNEEVGLFASLKNLFGKLMQNVSDELKKPVDELTNKLSKTKDIKQMKTIVANYLKVHNTALITSLKTVKTITELKKLMVENLTAIYASIVAQTKTLGEENISFSEIFADAPATMKKLFDKNEKNFNKNIDSFVTNLIILRAKPFGYTEEEIKSELGTVTESLYQSEMDMLFEQDAAVDPNAVNTPDATLDPNAAADSNAEKAKINAVAEGDKNAKKDADEKAKKNTDKLEKLKKDIKTWFDISIYKRINDELKKDMKVSGEASTTNLEDKIKSMTSTENTNSVKKIIDAMTKIDKQKLIQVRDILGLTKEDTPL